MDHCSEHPDGSTFQLRRFDFAGEDVCSVSEHVVFVCRLLLRTMFTLDRELCGLGLKPVLYMAGNGIPPFVLQ